jgi:hypothetical protein
MPESSGCAGRLDLLGFLGKVIRTRASTKPWSYLNILFLGFLKFFLSFQTLYDSYIYIVMKPYYTIVILDGGHGGEQVEDLSDLRINLVKRTSQRARARVVKHLESLSSLFGSGGGRMVLVLLVMLVVATGRWLVAGVRCGG